MANVIFKKLENATSNLSKYRVFQINCNFIKRYNFFLRRDKYTIFSAQDR